MELEGRDAAPGHGGLEGVFFVVGGVGGGGVVVAIIVATPAAVVAAKPPPAAAEAAPPSDAAARITATAPPAVLPEQHLVHVGLLADAQPPADRRDVAPEDQRPQSQIVEAERRQPVAVVADRVVVEELGAEERLEAADGGAAAEAGDGVDERDGDDLVLGVCFFCCCFERRGEGFERCRRRFLFSFLLAAVQALNKKTRESFLSFSNPYVFLPNLHRLERPKVVAAKVAHEVDVKLHPRSWEASKKIEEKKGSAGGKV